MATLTGYKARSVSCSVPARGQGVGKAWANLRELWPDCILSDGSVIVTGDLLDEIVDRVGIAETHDVPGHDLIASSRSRLNGRPSRLPLVGSAWRISART